MSSSKSFSHFDLKLVYEPSVYIVARSSVVWCELDEFLGSISATEFGNAAFRDLDAIPEIAGRLCYMSFGQDRRKSNEEYIGNIIEQGHGSVLEHSTIGMIITGVSRTLTHELVRHRVGCSYSQLSQRYVDHSEVSFVVPPLIADRVRVYNGYDYQLGVDPDPVVNDWLSSMREALNSYTYLAENLLESMPKEMPKTMRIKKAREAARSVLPGATETKIFVTMNMRSLRHFLSLRGSPSADAEINRLARLIFKRVGEYSMSCLQDAKFFDEGLSIASV